MDTSFGDVWVLLIVTIMLLLFTLFFLYVKDLKNFLIIGSTTILFTTLTIIAYYYYVPEGTLQFRCTSEKVTYYLNKKRYEDMYYIEKEDLKVVSCEEYKKYLRLDGDWKEVVE